MRFRVWCNAGNHWLVNSIHSNFVMNMNGEILLIDKPNNLQAYCNKWHPTPEVSLSTGIYFLDDDGEESDICIFSGDIVTDGDSNYLVKYDECDAKFVLVNTIDYREYDFSCVDNLLDIKIKGNKFENPELLENLK